MKKSYSTILLLVSILQYGQIVPNSASAPNTSVINPTSARLLPPLFNGQNSDLSGVNENYIYSRTYLEPTTSSNPQAKQIQSILFFDGLGKPTQNVAIHATPGGNDLVTQIPYDSYGRQVEDWLPVPMNSLNGNIQIPLSTSGQYKTASGSVDATIYGKKNLENSPLDRLQSYTGPGSDWSGKLVIYDNQINSDQEVYKFTATTSWNNGVTSPVLNSQLVSYPEGALYKTTVTDEDGKAVTEFKNEHGQILLVRKKGFSDTLDTYYVYNEFNQLAFIIPPLAAQNTIINNGISLSIMEGLVYQYRYDGWNRLVESKLPGKDWDYMVYDQADRLVMSQDPLLRSQGKWSFTKYDLFGRVVYTGLLNSSEGRQAQQAVINTNPGEVRNNNGFTDLEGSTIYYTSGNTYPQNNMTVLSVNYYDTYPPGSPSSSSGVITQSKLLASFIKNLEDNGWTKNYTYYDDKGRATEEHSINHLSGYTKTAFTLSFSGAPLNMLTRHKKDANSTEVIINESFVYDHQDRIIKRTHQINGGAEVTLAEYVYNELGQVENKHVGNDIQSVSYRYNTRGDLTLVNDPNSLNNKLFGFEIKYTNAQSSDALYNGNISEIDWATQSDGVLRRYSYGYDRSNRLTSGFYGEPNATNPNNYYFNESVGYDVNGNLLDLSRMKKLQNSIYAEYADQLKYTYANNSNKLIRVNDTTKNGNIYPIGGNTITYDDNGNMTSHMDKGISNIAYNLLSLPKQINQNTGNTLYSYRSDGVKQKKTHGNTVTDYIDGFQYTDGQLQFVPTADGYYDFVKNEYIYNYTDHLGNVRVSYLKGANGGAEIIKENNYYPFGLKHEGYNTVTADNPSYKYGYLENELQETGMYDMNARFYMPDLGRFAQNDPLSSLSLDPYGYAFNNPIGYKDPTGLLGESTKCPPDCSVPPNSPGGDNNPFPIQEVVMSGNPGGGYAGSPGYNFNTYPFGGYGYGDFNASSNSIGYTAPGKYNNTMAPNSQDNDFYMDYWGLLNSASTTQSYTTNGIGITLGTTARVSNDLVKAGKMIKTSNIFKTYNLYRSNGYLNGNKYISGVKFMKNVKAINALNNSKVVKGIGYAGLTISVAQFYESHHPGYISRGIASFGAGYIPYVGPTISLGIDNTNVNYWNIWTWGAMNRGSNKYDYLNR